MAAGLGASLALGGAGTALAAPEVFHMLPDGSNACKSWPATGGSGDFGTSEARQERDGNGAVPMYMLSAPSGCMNMPGLNYPHS